MKFHETLNYFFFHLFIFKKKIVRATCSMYNKIVCLEEIDAYYKYM